MINIFSACTPTSETRGICINSNFTSFISLQISEIFSAPLTYLIHIFVGKQEITGALVWPDGRVREEKSGRK